ncbi:MAG TPA: hypothetical protein VHA33_21485 [Candidatus Angelobacter sp.]|nr:hypothetical protein [Candidatus Angelobacter sp.]
MSDLCPSFVGASNPIHFLTSGTTAKAAMAARIATINVLTAIFSLLLHSFTTLSG